MFWLFLGIVGFVTGMEIEPTLFPDLNEFILFSLALALSLAGAVIAIIFQWLTVVGVGFASAAVLFHHLFPCNLTLLLLWEELTER